MKKILIITYHFAPYNNGGVFRALKFVKYLPDLGWTPLVLTCANPLVGFRDDDLLRDIPADTKIWRCPTLGIYQGMVRTLNWLAGWRRSLLKNRKEKFAPVRQPDAAHKTNGKTAVPGFIDRMFYNLFIPDGMIDWLPAAALMARRIIRQHQINVVMTTSPPHSTHLLGAVLARRKNVKWIADLRDPWLDNVVRNKLQAVSKYRQAVETRMEKWLVHHADRVIANTGINRDILLNRYPALSPDKVAVITNGFDAADLVEQPASLPNDRLAACPPFDEKPKKFVAAFSGYLYQGMAEPFFRALEKLLDSDAELAHKLSIQIIGQPSAYYQQKIAALNHGLSRIIHWLGPMRHRQALAHLQRSDLLLCFTYPTPDAAGWVPSKLYEYLMLAKPILAIGPEGEAAAMIRQAKAGENFAPNQEEEIAGALSDFLRQWENGSWGAELNREYIRRFDRRVLADKLAKLCETLYMQS